MDSFIASLWLFSELVVGLLAVFRSRFAMLCRACRRDDAELVARLVHECPSLMDRRGVIGYTPLQRCALRGATGAADVLLQCGVDVNAGYFWTPLSCAASRGHVHLCKLLIENGADVSGAASNHPDGDQPIHVAAGLGRCAVVQVLAENGADVDATTKRGDTPLHYAAWEGHIETARLLVLLGAAPNIATKRGRTPHDVAVDEDNLEIARLLENEIARAGQRMG